MWCAHGITIYEPICHSYFRKCPILTCKSLFFFLITYACILSSTLNTLTIHVQHRMYCITILCLYSFTYLRRKPLLWFVCSLHNQWNRSCAACAHTQTSGVRKLRESASFGSRHSALGSVTTIHKSECSPRALKYQANAATPSRLCLLQIES